MADLSVVPERFNDDGELAPMRQVEAPRAPYDFEGETITATSMKVSSANNLEIGDRRMKIGDLVEMTVVGKVTAANHVDDEKSGRITRVHSVKVVEASYNRSYSPAGGVEFL